MAQKNLKVVKAEFLLEEGIEAVRSFRDLDWTNFSNISSDIDYYFSFEDNFWVATSTNIFVDNLFERKLSVLKTLPHTKLIVLHYGKRIGAKLKRKMLFK